MKLKLLYILILVIFSAFSCRKNVYETVSPQLNQCQASVKDGKVTFDYILIKNGSEGVSSDSREIAISESACLNESHFEIWDSSKVVSFNFVASKGFIESFNPGAVHHLKQGYKTQYVSGWFPSSCVYFFQSGIENASFKINCISHLKSTTVQSGAYAGLTYSYYLADMEVNWICGGNSYRVLTKTVVTVDPTIVI